MTHLDTLTTRPCAKINLGLYVTERRPDGYHNLETVFVPIPLCDELSIRLKRDGEDDLRLEGITLEGDAKDNLVMRAAALLRQQGYEVPPVSIRLKKNIPSGAGLGGGSSDAAYTLRMLDEMLQLGIGEAGLMRMAATLGADCAFFIQDAPMFARGIGDILEPIELDLSGLWLTLVKPDDFVSTREAYGGVKPGQPAHPLRQSIGLPIGQWQALIENDFERSILPAHPHIARVKQQMMEAGALYTAMSGSGSSVFGLFPRETRIPSPYFQFTSPLHN